MEAPTTGAFLAPDTEHRRRKTRMGGGLVKRKEVGNEGEFKLKDHTVMICASIKCI